MLRAARELGESDMNCPDCGEENAPAAPICGLCKALLKPAAVPRPTAPAANPVQPAPVSPSVVPRAFILPQAPVAPPRSGPSAPAIVLALGVACLIGALVFRKAGRPGRAVLPAPDLVLKDDDERPTPNAPLEPIKAVPVTYDNPGSGRPIRSRGGVDPYGYPRTRPDPIRLLSLLHHRRFAELTQHLEWFQGEFENDYRKEYWPAGALEAFGTPDPAVTTLIDDWIQVSPTSFAPWAARAEHWQSIAWARRGTRFFNKTSNSQVRGMAEASARVIDNFKKAIELRPRLIAAHAGLIRLAKADSALGRMGHDALQQGLKLCPDCFLIRVAQMVSLYPRWGGSYEEMDEFAERSQRESKNPRLKLLAGYSDADRCSVASSNQDYRGALTLCDRAVAVGEVPLFFKKRAKVRSLMDDDARALADYDKAISVSPPDAALHRDRARSLLGSKQVERATADLLIARQLDPADPELAILLGNLASHYVVQGFQLEKQGRFTQAIERYVEALQLHPGDEQAMLRRKAVDMLRPVYDNAQQNPSDLEAHVRLDYQLASERRFDEVVSMWDRFIAAVPDEPRAYFERGGALCNLGKRPLGTKDFDRACALGLTAACEAAIKSKALKPRW
jgi:tetratricopeptide (TPR) repeat protein